MRASALLFPALLAACQDQGVKPVDATPEATILSPSDGTTVAAETLLPLSGVVTDLDDTDLDITWIVDGIGLCAGGLGVDGSTVCEANLAVGYHTITLSATDPSGAVGADSVTVVASSGDPPTAVIHSPGDDSVVAYGDPFTFEGQVADTEDPPSALTVVWESSLDGVLSTGPVDVNGLTIFTVTPSSGGFHGITLTVRDPDGHVAAATSGLLVDRPPDAPVPLVDPASPTTLDTLSAGISVAAEDPDGDPVTYAYTWYRDGVLAGSGASVDPSATTRGEIWTVAAVANDGWLDGPEGTASVVIGNSAPTADAAAITPDPAFAGDVLGCEAVGFADPDGDADLSTVEWTVNGVAAGTEPLLGVALVRGDRVVCTLTPSDGEQTGAPLSASLTVSNTPPVVDAVVVTPSPARADDTLSAALTAHDADGDTLTPTWTWYVDGVPVPSVTDTLDGSWFARGDEVWVSVTVSDGVDRSAATLSNVVPIVNTAPLATGAVLAPDPAYAGDAVTCAAVGFSDADGDRDASTVAWRVNGLDAGTGASPSVGLSHGVTVECTLTPSDGADTGTAVVVSLVVSDTAPVASGVTLSPAAPGTDDTLTASASATDADSEPISWTYAWYVDGVAVAATGSTLGGATWFDRDQSVVVVATPSDGTLAGSPVTSAAVTVVNTAPTAPVAGIDPPDPEEAVDDLVCAPSVAADDADGDAVSYVATWTVDGVATAGTTTTWPGDTVPAEDTLAGERWVCTLTPDDGTDEGPGGSVGVDILGEPVDYGHVQFPCTTTVARSGAFDVYGWVYMVGVTDAIGRGSRIDAEAGVGDEGTYPWVDGSWTWFAATYNVDADGPYAGDHANDEYVATLTAPARAGTYNYAYRFTTDGGLSWTYADLGGDACVLIGTTDGYDPSTAGVLTAY